MSKYKATVIKTGNSYALRVPKKYVEDAHLNLGQKVTIQPPLPEEDPVHQRLHELVLTPAGLILHLLGSPLELHPLLLDLEPGGWAVIPLTVLN
jgi:hypothetical protein